MQITVETLINAPRAEVFALAIDLARWPEFIKAIEKIEVLTPGPVRVGTRFRETRRMYGRRATEEMTLAELAAPERIVLTAENYGTRYRIQEHFIAEAAGTRIRIDFEGTPLTWTASLLAPLATAMAGSVKEQLAADLADIKRAAESGASTA